jgi:divalent metal cation (Fe/Co/Zn/Cd) transporter
VYFWSFVVSLLIFALGAGFSIYEGVSRVLKPVPIESPGVSYIVLVLAFVFEGGAWLVSLKQFQEAKGELGFFDAFRISKDPPLFMTLFEDSVALIGIPIASTSTFVAVALARPEIDGVGSVCIGLLLAVTSVFLARESKSLLMGEPAYPVVRSSILSIANAHPGCLQANSLITVLCVPKIRFCLDAGNERSKLAT